jgi:protein SCO1
MIARLFRLGLFALMLWLVVAPGLAQGPAAKTGIHQEGHHEAAYRGGLVTPALPKPNFKLTDTSGAAFDFKGGTDGYVTLLFFGYAHCATVCPTQMSYLAGAMRQLPREVTDQIKVVFVTTDPAQDNPQLLRAWLNHFDKNFIGLTGSTVEVEAAEAASMIPRTTANPAEHAAFVLAYTKDNLGHVIYPAGVTQSDWIHDLPELTSARWDSR